MDAGCVGWLATLVFRMTALPRAADETLRSGAVPRVFESRYRLVSKLYEGHMVLSYATFSLLGGAMLGGSLAPMWLGWTGIALGAFGVVGSS